MVKMGIMVCDRNRTCTGNKFFMALRDRDCARADRDNIRGYLNILVEDRKASEKYGSARPDFFARASL